MKNFDIKIIKKIGKIKKIMEKIKLKLDNFSQVIPFWQENVVKISRKKWKKFLDVKYQNEHIGKIKNQKN